MGVLAAVFGPGAVVSLLVSVGLCVLGVVAVVKIITKAGYSGWWALVPLSPVAVWIVNFAVLVHAANSPFSSSTSGSFDAASFVGLWVLDTVDALVILVFVLVFAFSEWPVHQQLRTQERRLQRAAEVLSAVLPPLRGKTRDPGWYAVGTAPNDQAYWDGQAWTARRRWSGASWTESSVGPTDTEGRPMTTVAATKATASTTASKKRMRQGQIVGLVVVVLVLAGAVSAVVLLRLTPLELPTGSETGTIQITTAGTSHPSFTGTIAGRGLTGSVTDATLGPSGSSAIETFTYEGSLGGHSYALDVSVVPASTQAGQAGFPGFSFSVTGTYGSELVSATSRFGQDHPNGNSVSVPVPFSGQVGSQKLSGTATAVEGGSGQPVKVTANFTVS